MSSFILHVRHKQKLYLLVSKEGRNLAALIAVLALPQTRFEEAGKLLDKCLSCTSPSSCCLMPQKTAYAAAAPGVAEQVNALCKSRGEHEQSGQRRQL